jgi:serine/threonine protein kinase
MGFLTLVLLGYQASDIRANVSVYNLSFWFSNFWNCFDVQIYIWIYLKGREWRISRERCISYKHSWYPGLHTPGKPCTQTRRWSLFRKSKFLSWKFNNELVINFRWVCFQAADIWSLGVTLYSLVVGQVPFHDENILALYNKIRVQALSFPDDKDISPELKDLVTKMLVKDPNKRITLPEIKVSLL